MSEPQNGQGHAPSAGSGTDRDDGVRLELKSASPGSGFVDGGWWPRSRDLRAELPDLVAALHTRLGERIGPVERVGFGTREWDPTGRQRLVTPTGRVAFGGFDEFEPDVVWMSTYSTALSPIALVVVPPETAHDRAMTTLRRASAADNTDRPAALLADENAELVGTTDARRGA